MNEAGDRLAEREHHDKGLTPKDTLTKFRTVVEDDTFLDLLDVPKTFPLLWDILGWNIQLYISHLIIYSNIVFPTIMCAYKVKKQVLTVVEMMVKY